MWHQIWSWNVPLRAAFRCERWWSFWHVDNNESCVRQRMYLLIHRLLRYFSLMVQIKSYPWLIFILLDMFLQICHKFNVVIKLPWYSKWTQRVNYIDTTSTFEFEEEMSTKLPETNLHSHMFHGLARSIVPIQVQQPKMFLNRDLYVDGICACFICLMQSDTNIYFM